LTDSTDAIRIIETYKNVGIHDSQSRERIEAVVKPEIDIAVGMVDPLELFAFALDPMRAPEARLAAAARCEAAAGIVTARRERGPAVDIGKLRAAVAGLDSEVWRSPVYYGTDLDARPGVLREEPLGPTNERPR
jgi:hypothetical protein